MIPYSKINKYRNIKVSVDGIKFDSKREAKRYCELKTLLITGIIRGLELQKKFELQASFKFNDKTIRSINYVADFYYYDNEKKCYAVEDTKGFKTKEYLIKKKMFMYKYQLEINEI